MLPKIGKNEIKLNIKGKRGVYCGLAFLNLHSEKVPVYIPQLLILGEIALISAGQAIKTNGKFSANVQGKNGQANSGVNRPTRVNCQRIATVPTNSDKA